MTPSTNKLFASEIVGCLGEGRGPTVKELFSVAERIWADGGADRSAFGWGSLPIDSLSKLQALRAAQLALCGVQ